MRMKTAAAGTSSRRPVWVSSRVRPSRRLSPRPSTTTGVEPDVDGGRRLDLGDEVGGHAGGQRVAADEQGDPGGELGQVQGGLTGRVGSAHDVHLLAGQRRSLHAGRPVEDAGADEPIEGAGCGRRR